MGKRWLAGAGADNLLGAARVREDISMQPHRVVTVGMHREPNMQVTVRVAPPRVAATASAVNPSLFRASSGAPDWCIASSSSKASSAQTAS